MTWAEWFRQEFNKLLLALLWLVLVVLIFHMSHDSRDSDQIAWVREAAGTILGALLGLITGVALASRLQAIQPAPPAPPAEPKP